VQHGTEAGASAFVPIRAERCVVDIPDQRVPERVERWRTIAKGASEQSFRSRIPTVGLPIKLEACIKAALETSTRSLLLHADDPANPLWMALTRRETPDKQVLLLVGPEGGWSPKEIEMAAGLGCELISLGPRILRTETAALVAISQLIYHYSRPQEFTSCES
jgi:16S rRNA (uracil1498-N3)-methyltransferase